MKSLFHFRIIVMIFMVPFNMELSSAQTVVQAVTGSKVSREDAQAALDFHNKARRDVNAPPLVWSAELAAYAQEWAEHLVAIGGKVLKHRPSDARNGKDVGENIFWGAGMTYTALDASKSWYSEIKDYSYSRIVSRSYPVTGHYTQMVWKASREVGIGIARFGNDQYFIVANYSPSGNYIGEYPY